MEGPPQDREEISLIEGMIGPYIQGTPALDSLEKRLAETCSEFAFTDSFDPSFVEEVVHRGCMPMAGRFFDRDYLLIKLHYRRCLLGFSDLHVEKSVRKRSARCVLEFDRDFDRCVAAISAQHGNCWLIPPLARALAALRAEAGARIAVHSVELYRDGELLAGEIGYVTGRIYTSMSGFFFGNGLGSVQMCALGRALEKGGFAFWDLGMGLPYKIALGAREISRERFLLLHGACRTGPPLPLTGPIPVADLIMGPGSAGHPPSSKN